MEPVKRSRTRSKSIALDKPPLDDTEEESKAVNLNGENVEEKPENDADVNSAPADEEESKPSEEEPSKDNEPEPEQEIPKESEDTVEQTELEVNEEVVDNSISKPTNNEKVNSKGGGRKRKASEMKSEDESIVEDKDKDSSATNSTINKEDDNKSSEKNLSDSDHSKNEKDETTSESSDLMLSRKETLDDTASESDLTIPSKETLGKGKRARIPNKRYSDILLSPNHKSKSLENGSEKIESENELPDLPAAKVTATPIAVAPTPTVTKRQSTSSPSVQQPNKKQKLPVDITNPLFLKPLDFGWKRELVWRATNDSNNKRMGDIYYYTPTGKKLRSMREVSENLKNKELTLDNFTFFKEPLGVDDPSKEIIRDAKYKMGTTVPKKLVTKIKSQRITSPKVSSPKVASPKLPPAKKVASPKLTPKTNETADSGTPASSAKGKSGTKKLGNFKIKLPAKSKMDKAKNKPDPVLDDSTESDSSTPKPATGTKRQAGRWSTRNSTPVTEPPRAKKRILKPNNITANSEKHEDSKFMDNYLQHLSYGYNTLLYVFQYLKVQDLLRAGCVCTMWRDIAGHPILWRTVRMKNSQVHSFEGLANTLKKHGTIHLDLRKMLLPSGGDEIWPQFSKAIERVDTLRKIELCRCPASVVEQLAVTNPNLEVINAVTIKCESMSLDPLSSLRIIKELRLKSTGGLNLHSIDALKELKTLRNLSLTSIRDLNKMNLNVIAELTNLESLDLGECTDFPENFGTEILSKLVNLERLRLEKGQGNCYTFEILDAVKDMSNLEQLELVNFDIKAGFDKALGACTNIKKLLIIPTYISQSATTNHMVLGGVLRLQKTLSHFVWGVTLELLRVTELFVDQCEEPEKKEKKEKKPAGNGDSIPVLKPVPLITDKDSDIPAAHDPPQVEILPLPNLQKLLLQSLPTTRVKILKIPFHATWRQSITDSVN